MDSMRPRSRLAVSGLAVHREAVALSGAGNVSSDKKAYFIGSSAGFSQKIAE
jgi:hypothetical protein